MSGAIGESLGGLTADAIGVILVFGEVEKKLREVKASFDEFGVVVDVFIPQGKRNRGSNYAF
ncbi:hypothetical protein SCA6_004064, partial [Theobroma cacao]